MSDFYHKTVFLKEAIDSLSIKRRERYIDATLGGGGHAQEILNEGGVVLGIDMDEDALAHVKERLSDNTDLTLVHGNFNDIDEIAKANGFETVSGIVMDLGVSSHQVDDWARGFSYMKNGPLDMRMDRSQKIKAADLLNILGKGELYEIFNKFGQEPRAHAIARSIVESRRIKAFEKTEDLTNIVQRVYGIRGNKINMKTKAQINSKVFQALRIAVNDELTTLAVALPKAVSILKSGGRLAVITFHSLEDKIVKQTFVEMQSSGIGEMITKKPMVPSLAETEENRRSRSAKLRVFQRS